MLSKRRCLVEKARRKDWREDWGDEDTEDFEEVELGGWYGV